MSLYESLSLLKDEVCLLSSCISLPESVLIEEEDELCPYILCSFEFFLSSLEDMSLELKELTLLSSSILF
jgi:hypothetical protein